MRPVTRTFAVLALFTTAAGTSVAYAQAKATATQALQLSAFAGLSGVYTGLDPFDTNGPEGRNLSFTAGFDVGFRPRYGLFPSIEVRGTKAVDDGQVDAEENILGGLKLERPYGRIHPYGDFLFGRGQITYQNGYPNAQETFLYLQTPSNVFSIGAGLDIQATRRFALKLDAQAQHYDTPVTGTGSTVAVPLTAALVYRFDFNGHRRRR